MVNITKKVTKKQMEIDSGFRQTKSDIQSGSPDYARVESLMISTDSSN